MGRVGTVTSHEKISSTAFGNALQADYVSQTDTATQVLGAGESTHDHAFKKPCRMMIAWNDDKALYQSLDGYTGKVHKTSVADVGYLTNEIIKDYPQGGSIYYATKSLLSGKYGAASVPMVGFRWKTPAYIQKSYFPSAYTSDFNIEWHFFGEGRLAGILLEADVTMFRTPYTILSQAVAQGATRVYVNSVTGFLVNFSFEIGSESTKKITAIGADYLDFTPAITLAGGYIAGTKIGCMPVTPHWSNLHFDGMKSSFANGRCIDLSSGAFDAVLDTVSWFSFGGANAVELTNANGASGASVINPTITKCIVEYNENVALLLGGSKAHVYHNKFWENKVAAINTYGNMGESWICHNEFKRQYANDIILMGAAFWHINDNYFTETSYGGTNTYSCIKIPSDGATFDDSTLIGNIVNGSASYKPSYFFEMLRYAYSIDARCCLNSFQGIGTSVFNLLANSTLGGTKMVIRDNNGYNPIGIIAEPFFNADTSGHCIVNYHHATKSAATPTASQTYFVAGSDILFTTTNSGNNDATLTIYDPADTSIATPTLPVTTPIYLPIGYKINWGAFTGAAPTVVACGV